MPAREDDAARLARSLAALPEPAMRTRALGLLLERLAPPDAARLCGSLVRRARHGPSAQVAVLALVSLLSDPQSAPSYEWQQGLYRAALDAGDPVLARLLLSARPSPAGAPQVVPIPGFPDATLGARKSLARRGRRELIDRLLRDPDPQVATVLLQNPRVTEPDVVRLAARRPTLPDTQRAIFANRRFAARPAVRRALVLNPYTPTDLAVGLCAALSRTDLRAVVAATELSDVVRQAARDALG
jgi:hypothetical protein